MYEDVYLFYRLQYKRPSNSYYLVISRATAAAAHAHAAVHHHEVFIDFSIVFRYTGTTLAYK